MLRSVTGMTRHTNGTLLPLMHPGSVIFSHNHSPSANDSNLLKRHNYGEGRGPSPLHRPLNQAAALMMNNRSNSPTFGKFGQKHVLNKYGRPII